MIRNKTMRNFFTLSVALHAFFILCFTDVIPEKKHMRRIEVDLRHLGEPRDIPRPPKIPKPPNIQQMATIKVRNIERKEIQRRRFPETIVESIGQDNITSPIPVAELSDIRFPVRYDFAQGYDPLAYYLNLVRQEIDKHKRYPLLAKRRSLKGSVRLKFVILRNGRAKDIQVVQSSGYNILNEAALEAVKKANPFPPFPEEMEESLLIIEVPVNFELIETM